MPALLSVLYFRPNSFRGEYLQQQRMLQQAGDHVRPPDAGFERRHAGFDLGDHAAHDDILLDQFFTFGQQTRWR